MVRIKIKSDIILTFPDELQSSVISEVAQVEMNLNDLGWMVYRVHPETRKDMKVALRFHFKEIEGEDNG